MAGGTPPTGSHHVSEDPWALRHDTAAELKAQLHAERTGVAFLVLRDDRDAQRIVPLDEATGRITVGRAPSNDVALTWDAHVSRVHAELRFVGDEWVVDDDGLSRNGSWVNGERLVRRRRLLDRDVIRVGTTYVRFRAPQSLDLGTTAIETGELPEATLSPAQRRVLVALCRPLASRSPEAAPATNQQIADELFLSVDAVKTHLRALFAKFGTVDLAQNRKRSALAARALSSGAVTVDDIVDR